MHSLLARQLKRSGIDVADLPENLQEFISAVNIAYLTSDQDRLLLERSLELSAKELFEQNEEMRSTLELLPQILQKAGSFNEKMSFRELLIKHVEDLNLSKDSLSRQAELLRDQAFELAVARDEALETSRLKSAFLANMSHEIRTPMNATLGLLKIVLGTELKPEQREYLNLAEQSSLGLLSIIEDILDFSKIEAGKLDIECIEFKPRHTIKSVLATVYNQAAIKGIELLADIDPLLPSKLTTDPSRLKQVLINLISNAIKFTSKGHVLLTVRWFGEENGHACRIHFSVKDTGIGIDTDKIDNIFKAFQQADGSVTRRFGGTGLGLSISQHLVGLLGGEIKINSTLGQGSEFYFDLNLAYSQGSDTIVTVRPDQLSRESFTIITESEFLSAIIERYLDHSSLHEVRVNLKTIDEITLDVGMLRGVVFYDMGFGLTEQSRITIDSLVTANSKVIVLASMFDLQVREELMSLGVKGVLFKPFIDSDLGLILRQAFRTKEEVLQQELETSVRSVAKQALKIVVVDDIQVNRLVAQRLLEQGGHEVVCFESGQAILHHLRNGREFNWQKSRPACECDLILMDVQMPGMDGIETTQLIRQWEAENEVLRSIHIPIVALTAHALKGDKERFIESGMDDALRKPIDSDALTSLLKRITLESNVESSNEVLVPTKSVVIFDMQRMMTRFDSDMSLVKEIVSAYLVEADQLSLNLENALKSEDHDTIRKAAHALRGSLLNVCASASSEIVSTIESFASEKKGGYNELADQLRKECGILKVELERVLG